MKNIEKLRLNVLTLVEAQYMADRINKLVVDLEALQGALKMTHRAYNLQTAQLGVFHAKSAKTAASLRVEYYTLLGRICEWESATGESHADLLDRKGA